LPPSRIALEACGGAHYWTRLFEGSVEFFEMLLIRNLGAEIASKTKVDWKNPKMICIAESYSKFDTDTVEVIPTWIELFKYRMYEHGIFSLEPLGVSE
jgi:hypothetical protein